MIIRLLLAALLLTACASPATGGSEVRVAAAADLRYALAEIIDEFAAAHPEIAVSVSYGSSGQYYQQLRSGAPFDLYLSADLDYPRLLVEHGLADGADLFHYAVGRIVLWAPNSSGIEPERGMSALLDPGIRRIAIANPEHAPYGQAAVAAMRTEGVYEQVADRLVLGENVSQAAEFVLSGNAQVGVIALSLALSPPMADAGRFWEVPLDDYPTIDQGGVIMGSAADRSAAAELRDFLLGPTGREILQRYGFREAS